MVWRTVTDFPDYEVSDEGLVRKNNLILKGFDNGGYLRIELKNESTKKKFLIHRLVALAFIPNPENKLQVNHKDLNRRNNKLENLEWVTNQENVNHALENNPTFKETITNLMSALGKKNANANSAKARKPVNQLDLDGNFIKTFISGREAAKELDLAFKVISKCCNGKCKTYKGFKFEFANK